MGALEPNERPIHVALIKKLFGNVQTIRELENGYAFGLIDDTQTMNETVEFISKERLCCPFFGFAIVLEPNGTGLWLHITGQEGIKPFIHVEFGQSLRKDLALKSGFMQK